MPVAVVMAGESTRHRRADQGEVALIHLHLNLRSSSSRLLATRRSRPFAGVLLDAHGTGAIARTRRDRRAARVRVARGRRLGRSPRGHPRCAGRRADRGSSRCRPRRAWRPRRAGRARAARSARRPSRRRDAVRARRRLPPARARPSAARGRRARRCRRRATRRARGGCARRAGASAIARSVLISESASAPASSAASAQAATSAVLGVSFTISGLAVSARSSRTTLSSCLGVGADVEARAHVRAGHVELDRGDLLALARRPPRAAQLRGARAHHVREKGHARSAPPARRGRACVRPASAGRSSAR